jgi:hypothetical protein
MKQISPDCLKVHGIQALACVWKVAKRIHPDISVNTIGFFRNAHHVSVMDMQFVVKLMINSTRQ